MEIVPPVEIADLTVGTILIWFMFISAIVMVALKLRSITLPLLEKVKHFFEDWEGEPARPGVEATPGIMERLAQLEYQLHPNHGSSMFDKVTQIDLTVKRHNKEFALIKRRLSALESKVNLLPQQQHRSKNEENPGIPNS